MTNWTFRNWTNGGGEVPVQSPDHADELLMEHSGWTEYGVVLEFAHADKGLITCVASTGFSTVGFNPTYDQRAHSMSDNRNAIPMSSASTVPFYFIDGSGVASSIPLRYVLPIFEASLALKHIIEYHDFPSCVRWSGEVPAG